MWLLVRPVGTSLLVLAQHPTRRAALRAAREIEGANEWFGVVQDTVGEGPLVAPPYLYVDARYKREAELDSQWQLLAPFLSRAGACTPTFPLARV